MNEREILIIVGAVVATTLLLTQASQLAEVFATILSAIARFIYITVRAIFSLLGNILNIIIRTFLPTKPPQEPSSDNEQH